MADQKWMDKVAAALPEAEQTFPAGTTYAPHDGTTSDFNQHTADMLVGPDVAADPTRVTISSDEVTSITEELS